MYKKDESMSDAAPESARHELIVVGASAGGIEALSVLVGTLKPDFPAPIVIAQHLDPHRPSQLEPILQRATTLKIVSVTEYTQMQPGTVYIVPSNQHIVINNGGVMIEQDHQNRPRPSVDLLLSTAAQSYGEGLFAVILTGSGSDGAVGAVEVKNAGGTVIIQNPATARYPSMPMALPATVVDHVADIEAIGPLLADLLHPDHQAPPVESSDNTLRTILDLVSQQANINFKLYKASTIIRRIGRRMAVTRSRTMRQYLQYIQAHAEEVGDLVGAFLINVTQFFRDPEAFTFLRERILPALIAQARDDDRVLRVWSAGCATGEEAYSLAMIISDLLGAERAEWNIKILATDLDNATINFARLGVYPENLLRNLPDNYRERFFERLDNNQGYRIVKPLRQMLIFGQQDLARSAPFPRIDLVLCRNVLIYFKPELQDHVLHNFAFSLRPRTGYLVLGKAETVRPALSLFKLVDKQLKIYRCSEGALPLPRFQGSRSFHLPTVEAVQRAPQVAEKVTGADYATPTVEPGQLRRLNELLLRFLPVGVVVVDRTYRMVLINATARRLLNVHDTTGEHDFLHAARNLPYATLRNAIDTVFRERNPVTLPDIEIDMLSGEHQHFLSLTLVLMHSDASPLVLISISDVSEQTDNRRHLEAAQAEQARLVAELETTNKRLNDMNKELVDANEALQISNEELVLTQEELQATVEEFETTNEELQATNEELETNNEELQATNEELETTNEELRATTDELEITTQLLDTERTRLGALLNLAPFYTIVCRGPELIVESIDERYVRLFNAPPVEDLPLRDATSRLWGDGASMAELAHRVYAENRLHITPRIPATRFNPQGTPIEEHYVFTIVPTLDNERRVDGVVLYIANETAQQLRARDEERERLQLIFSTLDQAMLALYDARTGQLLLASTRYLHMAAALHQVEPTAVIGRSFADAALSAQPDPQAQWQEVLTRRTAVHEPEVTIVLPDGAETIWDMTLLPLADSRDSDQLQYVLVSAIEITAQTRVRQELEQVERLRDEFLSLASHELRTPLTSLIGYMHILERITGEEASPQNTERMRQIVQTLSGQALRIKRLIDDLVDVSRLQNGKLALNFQEVQAVTLVERAIRETQTLTPTLPVHVFVQPEAEQLTLHADPDRLLQILINLIQNAITYAPESPHIDMRLQREQDETGRTWARIDVQDYGKGIPPEDVTSIFNRFYQVTRGGQRPVRGLGLGLFISQEIVQQHNGTIAVESTVGAGSTFSVRLPVAQA